MGSLDNADKHIHQVNVCKNQKKHWGTMAVKEKPNIFLQTRKSDFTKNNNLKFLVNCVLHKWDLAVSQMHTLWSGYSRMR